MLKIDIKLLPFLLITSRSIEIPTMFETHFIRFYEQQSDAKVHLFAFFLTQNVPRGQGKAQSSKGNLNIFGKAWSVLAQVSATNPDVRRSDLRTE